MTGRAAAAVLVLLGTSCTAAASDARLVRLAGVAAPAVSAGLASAGPSDPGGTQRAYDGGRDLMEDAAAVRPSAGCRALATAVRRFAAAAVRVPEAVDRLVDAGPARARAAGALAAVRAARPGCVPAGGGAAAEAAPRMSPGPGEVAFGAVVADSGRADGARLVVDDVDAGPLAIRAGRARGRLRAAPGRHTVRVELTRGGTPAGAHTARDVWVLPPGSAAARPASRTDPAARARLASIGMPAAPVLGLWVQDLAAGTAAGWNSGTAFPAASTVKLAVMVAALARDPRSPAGGRLAYDLRQIGGWSSNLAANRVLAAIGGPVSAQRVLLRLGAASSTYTGDYAVGTELQPGLPADGVARPVPRVSGRVTTAADLARILFAVHAAATGDRAARSASGLSTRAARVLLGDLLASEQRGENLSLLAPGVPEGSLLAQKNGWLRAARHGAAILYTPRGPRIAVMLSYSATGVPLRTARALGGRLAAVAAR
ncbi:MAG: serine hydrolase [Thermoleophilia bacterium]|nr:serine hydrolase [Thermoleophilia bacterium]